MRACILASAAIFACQGCTTVALQRHTIDLAQSSTDLRYREVVENLAMIAHNRATLPSFSSFFAGTADISDTVTISAPTVWNRTLKTMTAFSTQTLDVPFTRSIRENWTLDPVIVPEKLRALRCACWWVLDRRECIDCGENVHLDKYVPGEPAPPAGCYFDVADLLRKSIRTPWLRYGKCDHACYEADYHGTYVYVTRPGIEGLSDFTLALQAIARVSFDTVYCPKPVTRTITLEPSGTDPNFNGNITKITVTVDKNGHLTPGENAYSLTFQPKLRVDITPACKLRRQTTRNFREFSGVFHCLIEYLSCRGNNVGKNAELRSAIAASKSP